MSPAVAGVVAGVGSNVAALAIGGGDWPRWWSWWFGAGLAVGVYFLVRKS